MRGFAVLTPVTARSPGGSEANAYVGSEACKTCHADVWLNFYKNPHYQVDRIWQRVS